MQWRTRSRRYSERAEECRVLADLGSPTFRDDYLQLAATYDRLAEQAERLELVDAPLGKQAGRPG